MKDSDAKFFYGQGFADGVRAACNHMISIVEEKKVPYEGLPTVLRLVLKLFLQNEPK